MEYQNSRYQETTRTNYQPNRTTDYTTAFEEPCVGRCARCTGRCRGRR